MAAQAWAVCAETWAVSWEPPWNSFERFLDLDLPRSLGKDMAIVMGNFMGIVMGMYRLDLI